MLDLGSWGGRGVLGGVNRPKLWARLFSTCGSARYGDRHRLHRNLLHRQSRLARVRVLG